MKIKIINATIKDYQLIQNMARFYVYDLSKECGLDSVEWEIPEDGLYESSDFRNYFEESQRKAYLVKVNHEIAGFVLLHQVTEDFSNKWNIGEFFIIARFQGRGVASQVAYQIWTMHPGKWLVSVIPENTKALRFWEKTINNFTNNNFLKKSCKVTYDNAQPKRIVFEFNA